MTPSPKTRAFLAAVVGVLAGATAAAMAARPQAIPDLLYLLTAARLYLDGVDPYTVMTRTAAGAPPFDAPLYYPFPTILALLPFARLSLPLACGLVVGLCSSALAWLITRDGLWRLHVFASASFVVTVILAQITPLALIAALAPSVGFLALFKPNSGAAALAAWPSRRAFLGMAIVVGLSVALLPAWPIGWLDGLRHDASSNPLHLSPVRIWQWGGPLLLLSLGALRLPSGRLLAVMSLAPQLLFFYDQLVLWLIPRTRKESLLLTASSQLAMLLWFLLREPGSSIVRSAAPFVILLVYFPALCIVLGQLRADRRQRAGAPAADSAVE